MKLRTDGRTRIGFALPIIITFFVLQSAVFTQEEQPKEVSFNWTPPAEGTEKTFTSTWLFEFKYIIGANGKVGGTIDKYKRYDVNRTTTYLKTTKDKVQKIKISYSKAHKEKVYTYKDVDEKKPEVDRINKDNPVVGNSYIFAVEKGKPKVTYEGGGEVPDEERNFILNDYVSVDDLNSEKVYLKKLLDGKTVKVGKTLHGTDEAIKAIENEWVGQKVVKNLKVTVKKIEKAQGMKSARLDVHFNITTKDPQGMELKMDMNGEVLVSLDGMRVVSSAITGSISASGSKKRTTDDGKKYEAQYSGTGSYDISETVDWNIKK